jgi:hypothetical protein
MDRNINCERRIDQLIQSNKHTQRHLVTFLFSSSNICHDSFTDLEAKLQSKLRKKPRNIKIVYEAVNDSNFRGIYIYDVVTQLQTTVIQLEREDNTVVPFTRKVREIIKLRDGNILVGTDDKLRVLNVCNAECDQTMGPLQEFMRSFELQNGSIAFHDARGITIWNRQTQDLIAVVAAFKKNICMTQTQDGSFIYSQHDSIYLTNDMFVPFKHLDAMFSTVGWLGEISPGKLLSINRNGRICVWETSTGKLLKNIPTSTVTRIQQALCTANGILVVQTKMKIMTLNLEKKRITNLCTLEINPCFHITEVEPNVIAFQSNSNLVLLNVITGVKVAELAIPDNAEVMCLI